MELYLIYICDQQLVSQQKPGKPNENNISDHATERHKGFKIYHQYCYYDVSSKQAFVWLQVDLKKGAIVIKGLFTLTNMV